MFTILQHEITTPFIALLANHSQFGSTAGNLSSLSKIGGNFNDFFWIGGNFNDFFVLCEKVFVFSDVTAIDTVSLYNLTV